MDGSVTIWSMLAQCVTQLDEPFRASEIVGWFRRHHPEVNEGSLRAHIQSATSNVSAGSKIGGVAGRRPLLTRVDHGGYVRYVAPANMATEEGRGDGPRLQSAPRESHGAATADDVVLIGCTSRKAGGPSPARDLFIGESFRKA